MSARLPARARLVVALLASAMAATACGSRLETGQLEAANGVLTRHANATGAAGTAGGHEAATPGVSANLDAAA